MVGTAKHWVAYVWIAILAILFNALVPVASHAVNAWLPVAADTAAGMEVCTAMGMETMAMPAAPDASGESASDKLIKGMTHCGYCVTHAGSFGLPPQVPALVAVLGGHDLFPTLFFQAPRPLFSWSPAQARAPPFLA